MNYLHTDPPTYTSESIDSGDMRDDCNSSDSRDSSDSTGNSEDSDKKKIVHQQNSFKKEIIITPQKVWPKKFVTKKNNCKKLV